MQFIIISGLSGAGKSRAASDLEDLGFYCVDNMPAEMIPQFASLCLATKGRYEKVALVTDVRSSMTFDSLFQSLDKLDEMHLEYAIFFIEASTEVIIKRFKETRRLHPLMRDGTPVLQAVERERQLLEPVRTRASAIIDTSNLSTGKLRGKLIDLVAGGVRERAMHVTVLSFGFKYGLPLDAFLTCGSFRIPTISRNSKRLQGSMSRYGISSSSTSRRRIFWRKPRICWPFCCQITWTRGRPTLSSPSAAREGSTGHPASQRSSATLSPSAAMWRISRIAT
jgi:predicted ATPase